jgi:hypothetical protein
MLWFFDQLYPWDNPDGGARLLASVGSGDWPNACTELNRIRQELALPPIAMYDRQGPLHRSKQAGLIFSLL